MSVKKVTLTYDRHAAQRGYERRWGEAVGGKVPQLPDTHENHAAPPHHGGVVGFGAALSLTDVGIFLSGRDGERARGTSQIKERQKKKVESCKKPPQTCNTWGASKSSTELFNYNVGFKIGALKRLSE